MKDTVSIYDICDMIGVKRSTLFMIRRTFSEPFPQPVAGSGNHAQEFDAAEARAYAAKYFEREAQALADKARLMFDRAAELGGING